MMANGQQLNVLLKQDILKSLLELLLVNYKIEKSIPKVYDYLLDLREEQHKKYHVNYNRHMRRLASLSKSAGRKGNYTAAVSAEVSRGKAAGLYVDRKRNFLDWVQLIVCLKQRLKEGLLT